MMLTGEKCGFSFEGPAELKLTKCRNPNCYRPGRCVLWELTFYKEPTVAQKIAELRKKKAAIDKEIKKLKAGL